MARRLCLDERARIEAMARAGRGAARIARCLGRHRSTVQRELARAGGPQEYRAGFAQQAAGARARRPRAPKLARDRVLAAAVAERLEQRWAPTGSGWLPVVTFVGCRAAARAQGRVFGVDGVERISQPVQLGGVHASRGAEAWPPTRPQRNVVASQVSRLSLW